MFYKWAISVLFWFTDQAGTLQWRVKLYLLTLHHTYTQEPAEMHT